MEQALSVLQSADSEGITQKLRKTSLGLLSHNRAESARNLGAPLQEAWREDSTTEVDFGKYASALLAENLTSEALLVASLLLNEEERKQILLRALKVSRLRECGSPLYTLMMIRLGEIDQLLLTGSQGSFADMFLVPHWQSHCFFVLQNAKNLV